MAKHTQTIRWLLPGNYLMLANCLSVLDHFVGLALEGLGRGITSCRQQMTAVKLLHKHFKQI